MTHPPRSDAFANQAAVTRYSEIPARLGIGTPILFDHSMPCAIVRTTWLCGKGATQGSVRLNPDGTWTLLPICDDCIRELLVLYTTQPA